MDANATPNATGTNAAANTAETNGPAPAPAPVSDDFKSRLEAFIDTDVRPFLQSDGGDIELIDYKDGVVKVRLQGACGTCPSSIMTLRFGVERRLKEVFPGEVQAMDLVDGMDLGMPGGHGHGHF